MRRFWGGELYLARAEVDVLSSSAEQAEELERLERERVRAQSQQVEAARARYVSEILPLHTELAEVVEAFSACVKGMSGPKAPKNSQDKLKDVKLVATEQVGRLKVLLKQAKSMSVPDGFEDVHKRIRGAIGSLNDYLQASIQVAGRPYEGKSALLGSAAMDFRQNVEAYQNDPRLSSALKPEIRGVVLSDLVDRLGVVTERQAQARQAQIAEEERAAAEARARQASPYRRQMRQLLSKYLESRKVMQQWADAARVNPHERWNDRLLMSCYQKRLDILTRMKALVPDAGYENVHDMACRLVAVGAEGTLEAYRTNNPNDRDFQAASAAIQQVQGPVLDAFGL